jgi:hypothetical protein
MDGALVIVQVLYGMRPGKNTYCCNWAVIIGPILCTILASHWHSILDLTLLLQLPGPRFAF